MQPTLYIATRKSPLALWQANYVKQLLEAQEYSPPVSLLPVVTTGDVLQGKPLREYTLEKASHTPFETGKGLFIKEIQEALCDGRAHVAVHSMKDLPVPQTQGLCTGALLPRAMPCDALVLSPKVLDETGLRGVNPWDVSCLDLQQALGKSRFFATAPLGTTSLRRQGLLKHHWGVNHVIPLRGNVDTRLGRLKNNEFSAILLACAGLERLRFDFQEHAIFPLPQNIFVPAAAQGVIALEVSAQDGESLRRISPLNCAATCLSAGIERYALSFLGGDCHTAVGCFYENNTLSLFWDLGQGPTQRLVEIKDAHILELEDLLKQHKYVYSHFFQDIPRSGYGRALPGFLGSSGR